jgi:hypothetical protein
MKYRPQSRTDTDKSIGTTAKPPPDQALAAQAQAWQRHWAPHAQAGALAGWAQPHWQPGPLQAWQAQLATVSCWV